MRRNLFMMTCRRHPGGLFKGYSSAYYRLIGEVTTEIAYGIYKNEERDFVDLNLSLPMVDFKKVNGYLVELLPSRVFGYFASGDLISPHLC